MDIGENGSLHAIYRLLSFEWAGVAWYTPSGSPNANNSDLP